MNKEELQVLAKRIMDIDHVGCQSDDVHENENKHQIILELDKMDKFDVVRFLMHIIEVQQLQICDAEIRYTENNPFRNMVNFEHISEYLKNNSPNQRTLY